MLLGVSDPAKSVLARFIDSFAAPARSSRGRHFLPGLFLRRFFGLPPSLPLSGPAVFPTGPIDLSTVSQPTPSWPPPFACRPSFLSPLPPSPPGHALGRCSRRSLQRTGQLTLTEEQPFVKLPAFPVPARCRTRKLAPCASQRSPTSILNRICKYGNVLLTLVSTTRPLRVVSSGPGRPSS